MRNLFLLAGLITGLSLGAVGNSITSTDYDTGSFLSGTITGSFTTSLSVSIKGMDHSIDISTGTLVRSTTGCPPGSMCFSFTGGSVTVDGTVFKDSLSGGITIKTGGTGSINAILMPEMGVGSGSADASFVFKNGMITAGSENVSFTSAAAVPEPATLLLFGTGLIPLAWRMRKGLAKKCLI